MELTIVFEVLSDLIALGIDPPTIVLLLILYFQQQRINDLEGQQMEILIRSPHFPHTTNDTENERA